jgi:predicted ATPase/DNA-binding SARP family transcriptional activator
MAQQVEPLTIRLLGRFEVWRDGSCVREDEWRRKPAKSLLGTLLTEPGQTFLDDALIELLLRESGPERGLNYLYALVSHLRTVLEPRLDRPANSTFVLRATGGYCFNENAPYTLDTESFRTLIEQADRLRDHRRWDDAREQYQQALALYEGEFVPGALYEEWAQASRERHREAHLHALACLAECQARTGALPSAIGTCEELIRRQPWNEIAHRQKMYYHYCQGELGAAEETYRLCAQRLAGHLDIEPSQETSDLHDRIRRGEVPKVERWIPSTLPHLLTSFIGREEEVRRVTEKLREHRLVTLTGFGGIGKTRLALKAGSEHLEGYKDGVWFVDLGLISEAEDLPRAVAKALRITPEKDREPIDTIVDHLKGREALLVLDTCEHLIDRSARLAQTLLHAAPGLRILATSREALNLAGELVWNVPALSTPEEDATLDTLRQSDAVRLFLDRAGTPDAPLRLTRANGPLIATLCRRLDGLPLALELAANTVRSIGLRTTVEHLDDRLRVLSHGKRAAPGRHATLAAMIDWSYELLTSEEQAVFQRLSTFAGGCTLEAAASVCVDASIDRERLQVCLGGLQGKSLLTYDPIAGQGRYHLLEILREYAGGKLRESGEQEICRKRHRDFFLQFVLRADTRGPAQREWLERLEAELENLRSALAWTERVGEIEVGLQLAGANSMAVFWERNRHLAEGLTWLHRLLERSADGPSSAAADGWTRIGTMRWLLGEAEEAKGAMQQGVLMARQLEDERCLGTALVALGNVQMALGDDPSAKASFEEALALDRRIGRTSGVAACLANLGIILRRQGESAHAIRCLHAAWQHAHRLGHLYKESAILRILGGVHEQIGAFDEAKQNYEQALERAERIGDRESQRQCLLEMGTLGLGVGPTYRGDPAEGLAYTRRALDIAQELGDPSVEFITRLNRAILLSSLGDHPAARGCLRECVRLGRLPECRFDPLPLVPLAAEVMGATGMPQRAMQLLGAAETADSAFREPSGHAYMDVSRIEIALRDALGPRVADEALEEGRTMDLDDLLNRWLLEVRSEDEATPSDSR